MKWSELKIGETASFYGARLRRVPNTSYTPSGMVQVEYVDAVENLKIPQGALGLVNGDDECRDWRPE